MRITAVFWGVLTALVICTAASAGPYVFAPQQQSDPYTECGTNGKLCTQ